MQQLECLKIELSDAVMVGIKKMHGKKARERERIVSKKWACNNHVSLLNLNLILAIWPHHPVNEKMVCMHSKRESGRSRIQQLLLKSVVKKSGLSILSGLENIVHLSFLLSRYYLLMYIMRSLFCFGAMFLMDLAAENLKRYYNIIIVLCDYYFIAAWMCNSNFFFEPDTSRRDEVAL